MSLISAQTLRGGRVVRCVMRGCSNGSGVCRNIPSTITSGDGSRTALTNSLRRFATTSTVSPIASPIQSYCSGVLGGPLRQLPFRRGVASKGGGGSTPLGGVASKGSGGSTPPGGVASKGGGAPSTPKRSPPPPRQTPPPIPKGKTQKFSNIGPITWRSLAIAAGVGVVVVYFVRREVAKKEREMNKVETIGKMDVGGPWEGLVDSKGVSKSSADYHGQWLFLYFGFTHCPDICPDELEKICQAVDIVDSNPDFPNVQPVFLTIDPGRDTPERVDAYIKDFSPKLQGLTGDREKVSQVARLFRIYQSEGPKDEDNDYIVDHSIITYLVDPSGECCAFFTKTQRAEVVATTTFLQMKQYQLQHITKPAQPTHQSHQTH